MNKNKQEPSLKEKLAEACFIPKEAILGYSVLSIVGNCDLIIENHKGILEYNTELIRVSTKSGQIRINGKGLNILQYADGEMKINGVIKEIEFI